MEQRLWQKAAAPFSLAALAIVTQLRAVTCSWSGDDVYVLPNLASASWARRLFAFNVDAPSAHYFTFSSIVYERRFVRVVPCALLWLEHRCFGYDAAAFHAVTLAIHIVNVLLVYTLVLRWLGDARWAALAAAIPAAHPAATEIVAWANCQPLASATTCMLLAVAAWVRARDRQLAGDRPAPVAWLLALIATLAALTSYEATIALPPLVIVADMALLSGRSLSRAEAWRPRAAMLGTLVLYAPIYWAVHHGTAHPETAAPWTAGEAWRLFRIDGANYVLKTLAVFDAKGAWGYWLYNRVGEPWALGSVLAFIGVAVVWARTRPMAWLGLVAWAAMLAPPLIMRVTVSMMNNPSLRQIYMGVFALALVAGAMRGARERSRRGAPWAALGVAAWILILGAQSVIFGGAFYARPGREHLREEMKRALAHDERPVVLVGDLDCGFAPELDWPSRTFTRAAPATLRGHAPHIRRVDATRFEAFDDEGLSNLVTYSRRSAALSAAPAGSYNTFGPRAILEPMPLLRGGVARVEDATIVAIDHNRDYVTRTRVTMSRPLDDYIFVALERCASATRIAP